MLSLLEVATVYSYSKKEWCAHLALIYQALSSCFICRTAKHEDKVRELVEQTGTLVLFMVFRRWHDQPACRLGISRSRSEIPICVLSISLWSLKLCSRVLILWGKSNQFVSLIPWLTIIMLGHAEWKQSELSAPCHLYGWIHLVCQITWINGSLRSNASL